MTNAISYLVEFKTTSDSIKEIINVVKPMVIKVAYFAFSILFQAPFFYFYPSPSVYSFAFGFFHPEYAKDMAKKVHTVLNSIQTTADKVTLAFFVGIPAIIAMPPTLIVLTLYTSAQWGAYFYTSSNERLRVMRQRQSATPSP